MLCRQVFHGFQTGPRPRRGRVQAAAAVALPLNSETKSGWECPLFQRRRRRRPAAPRRWSLGFFKLLYAFWQAAKDRFRGNGLPRCELGLTDLERFKPTGRSVSFCGVHDQMISCLTVNFQFAGVLLCRCFPISHSNFLSREQRSAFRAPPVRSRHGSKRSETRRNKRFLTTFGS